MRGGSQAFLVEGEDARCYVAKFVGNPQGTRTLINEWVTAYLLKAVSVVTPELITLKLDPAICGQYPELAFVTANRVRVTHGLHLGSTCPVDPDQHSIYDLLPSALYKNLVNFNDFVRVAVVDILVGQTDRRQAVYVLSQQSTTRSIRAHFIDHGHSFGASLWAYADRLPPAVSWKLLTPDSIEHIDTAVQLLQAISIDALYRHAKSTPEAWWTAQDHVDFERLIRKLALRLSRLNELIEPLIASITEHVVATASQFEPEVHTASCLL
jgi:hypothetical protein